MISDFTNNNLLWKLGGAQYAVLLVLNMGHYHIELNLAAQEMCTIVLPLGKYRCNEYPWAWWRIPLMYIFQEKMPNFVSGLELYINFESAGLYQKDIFHSYMVISQGKLPTAFYSHA